MPKRDRFLRVMVLAALLAVLVVPIATTNGHVRADESGTDTVTTTEATPASADADGESDVTTDNGTAPSPSSLRVQTVDAETGEPLTGACYQLLTIDDGAPVSANRCDSDDEVDGATRLTDLTAGDFTLVQTTEPDGYLIADSVIVTIDEETDQTTDVANAAIPATEAPTEVPTDIATEVATDEPVQTEPPTSTATPEPRSTRAPRRTPRPTKTPRPAKTATPDADEFQIASTTGFRIKMDDDDGGLVAASCITFKEYETYPSTMRTKCDGASPAFGGANNDAKADGYIDVSNIAPGRYVVQGNEAKDTTDPAPLPLVVTVQDGQTTQGTLVFHRYGYLEVRLRGATGQLVNGCAKLSWDWEAIGGDRHSGGDALLTDAGQHCDADDGAQDGVTHFYNLPVGVYWLWTETPERNPQYGSQARFTVTEETPVLVTSYLPSATLTVKLVDATTGGAVNGVRVAVLQEVGDGHQDGTDSADIDGSHTFTLPPATYRLETVRRYDQPERYDYATANVTLSSPGEHADLVIRLTPKNPSTTTPTPTPTKTPTQTPTPTPKPACALSKTESTVNSTFSVSCTGYHPRETLGIYWDRTDVNPLTSVVADASGKAKVKVTVPRTKRGTHKVIIDGTWDGPKLTFSFKVKASAVLTPAKGKIGTSVSIDLHGFMPGETVTVRWYGTDGTSYKTIVRNAEVSPAGELSIGYAVPSNQKKGSHRIEVIGSKSTTVSVTFTVT